MHLGAIGRRLALPGALAGVILLALAIVPGVANASSYGCTASGAGLPWYGLNTSYTCITVLGHGNNVAFVKGAWKGIGTLCNWQFRVRFWNNSNQLVEQDLMPEHYGCTVGNQSWTKYYPGPYKVTAGWSDWLHGVLYWGTYSAQYKPSGKVCVAILESGSVRSGTPCEYIHS